jgi:predicted solute-binding protein
VLEFARDWGCARLDTVADEWAPRMSLPLERVRNYLIDIMRYDLNEDKWRALEEFQARCLRHNLVHSALPLR